MNELRGFEIGPRPAAVPKQREGGSALSGLRNLADNNREYGYQLGRQSLPAEHHPDWFWLVIAGCLGFVVANICWAVVLLSGVGL